MSAVVLEFPTRPGMVSGMGRGKKDKSSSRNRLSWYVPGFLSARSYRPASERQRRQVLHQFVEFTGDPPPPELTPSLVLDWWSGLSRLRPASRQSHLSAVKVFCKHLRAINAMDSDPTEPIARPRNYQQLPVTLTVAEIIRFLQSLYCTRDRAIVALMLGCGLRSSDVSSVNVDDIDWTRRILTVVGKGGKQRSVPVPQATIECLTDYLVDKPCQTTASGFAYGPLIRHHHSQDRLAAAPVQQRVTKLLYEAGIKLGPHDGRSSHVLRRTCASTLLESGASIRDVQTILGHESIATTEHYLRRPDEERMVSLIERGPMGAA